MYVHYDFSHSNDTRSYLRMAQGEFRGVSITRRYRVLVPLAARAVAWPMQQVYARVWPQRAADDWPLRLAFYLVNSLLMGAVGLVMFRTCLLYGASPGAAALAMVAALLSRWTVYITGLPLVDSLYLLVVALGLYAVRRGSAWALVLCLLLGPHAKESFVFWVPWLLLFGQGALRWPAQLVWLAVSFGLAWLVRHSIDVQVGAPPQESVQNALNHLENLTYSLRRMASPKGLGELFSIFGFFWLALLAGWRTAGRWQWPRWWAGLGWPALGVLLIVAIHMLLSGDLGRMGYLAAPLFAVALARALTYEPAFAWLALTPPPAPPLWERGVF